MTTISQQIRTELNRNAVLSTSRFYVNIPAPKFLLQPGLDTKSVLLMCQQRGATAVLPGLQINTSSIRRYTVGLEERKPIAAAVIDQQFTFICDKDAVIHDFFNIWLNSIVTANKFAAVDVSTNGGADPTRYPGSVLYKTDYTVDLQIVLYGNDQNTTPVKIVTLYNAFPVAIGDVQLSWSNSNDFIQVPVTFTYTHWKSEEVRLSPRGVGRTNTGSVKDLLFKAGSAALLLSTLRKPQNVQDILGVVNNAKTIISGFNLKFG